MFNSNGIIPDIPEQTIGGDTGNFIDSYLKKIDIQRVAREPSVEKGEKGATLIDAGYSEEQIERKLDQIRKIAKWAIDHDYGNLHAA